MWFCMHVETAYFLNWLPHKNDKTNTYGVEIIFNTKPWLAQTRKNISEHRLAYFVKKKKNHPATDRKQTFFWGCPKNQICRLWNLTTLCYTYAICFNAFNLFPNVIEDISFRFENSLSSCVGPIGIPFCGCPRHQRTISEEKENVIRKDTCRRKRTLHSRWQTWDCVEVKLHSI